MPLPYHLIDGYNVLHAAGLARATYGPGDLERARTALLIRFADGLDDTDRERTTVVFDAIDPPADAEPSFRFRGMAVLFAVDYADADALIEGLIRKHPSPRQVRVVSDDVRLQKAAKRRGSQAVKSDAFLRRLKRHTAPADAKARPQGADQSVQPVAEGVDDWMTYFDVGSGPAALEDLIPPDPPRREAAAAPHERAPIAGRSTPAVVPPKGGPAAKATKGSPAGDASGDEASEAGEEFGFWQQRIDDLLREEGRRGSS